MPNFETSEVLGHEQLGRYLSDDLAAAVFRS
jgi:hypothetical protein